MKTLDVCFIASILTSALFTNSSFAVYDYKETYFVFEPFFITNLTPRGIGISYSNTDLYFPCLPASVRNIQGLCFLPHEDYSANNSIRPITSIVERIFLQQDKISHNSLESFLGKAYHKICAIYDFGNFTKYLKIVCDPCDYYIFNFDRYNTTTPVYSLLTEDCAGLCGSSNKIGASVEPAVGLFLRGGDSQIVVYRFLLPDMNWASTSLYLCLNDNAPYPTWTNQIIHDVITENKSIFIESFCPDQLLPFCGFKPYCWNTNISGIVGYPWLVNSTINCCADIVEIMDTWVYPNSSYGSYYPENYIQFFDDEALIKAQEKSLYLDTPFTLHNWDSIYLTIDHRDIPFIPDVSRVFGIINESSKLSYNPYLAVNNNEFICCTLPANRSTPEPATIFLLALGAVFIRRGTK